MASIGSIEVNVRLAIDKETAEACLRIASLYAAQSGRLIALQPCEEGPSYAFKEARNGD